MTLGIEIKVKKIVAKLAKVPIGRISSTADMRKLGIDSLMALEVMANLEKAFKIHIPEGRIRRVIRVDQIVKLIGDLRSESSQRHPSLTQCTRKLPRRRRVPKRA